MAPSNASDRFRVARELSRAAHILLLGLLTFQIAYGSESSTENSRRLASGSVGGLVFPSSNTGMLAPSNQLLVGDISALEGGLNGTLVDWFEKLPRLLAMLIGRLEDSEKLPTLLTGCVEGSMLRQQVRLPISNRNR